jgi:hypothetical protein
MQVLTKIIISDPGDEQESIETEIFSSAYTPFIKNVKTFWRPSDNFRKEELSFPEVLNKSLRYVKRAYPKGLINAAISIREFGSGKVYDHYRRDKTEEYLKRKNLKS